MLTVSKEKVYASVDSIFVRSTVDDFVRRYKIEFLLLELVFTYIGADNVDRLQSVADIARDLSVFKLELTIRGRKVKVAPDDLY